VTARTTLETTRSDAMRAKRNSKRARVYFASVVLGLRGRRRARRRARDAKGTSKRRVKTSDVRCARHVATASCQVRSMRTFFTHPSVSIFDRVPFQRTDEHLSKITRSASTAVAPKISRPD
jgi:hypothetical protein